MFVFAILGIFSATHRQYAKEAFECAFRMATLRPCQSDFDQKMKTKILASLMRFPSIANFTNKYFKAISTVMVILFLASLAYTAYGVYNLATYGTCDPQHPENCVFTPFLNGTVDPNANVCTITGDFVEFYGEECPHCIRMKPIVATVEQESGITFQKLEVWHNETNQKTMTLHADDIERDCGMMGVPAFYAVKTGKAICGEVSADKLKDFIRTNG
jgi:thiol-disulfide isomerase/thioredoxin